ncbi:MAG: hypothetical protein WD738_17275 [Pirellulales bacterium]
MSRAQPLAIAALACLLGAAALTESQRLTAATDGSNAAEIVSQIAARLIADAIPHEYERSKDWGRTKHITTGLRSSGNFFDFDIHRRKSAVNHGVWKKYRVTLVEPDKNLVVRIENLRSTAPGRVALTLFVTAKLHGWARAKVYDRGIHVIALEAEGNTTVRLWLDTEIAVEPVPTKSFVPGIAIRPIITTARLKLDNFRLTRVSDLRGSLAHELGDGLRHLIQDELSAPKLVAKLNRSIEKRRDRLEFTPDMLLSKSMP